MLGLVYIDDMTKLLLMKPKAKFLKSSEIDVIAEAAILAAKYGVIGSNKLSKEDEARVWSKMAVLACDKGDELLGINTKGSA